MPDCIYKTFEKDGEEVSAGTILQMTFKYEQLSEGQNFPLVSRASIPVLALPAQGNVVVSSNTDLVEVPETNYQIAGIGNRQYNINVNNAGDNLDQVVNAQFEQFAEAQSLTAEERSKFLEEKFIDLDDEIFGFFFKAVQKGVSFELPHISFDAPTPMGECNDVNCE